MKVSVKIMILCAALAIPSLAFADEYTNDNGNEVGCNGYDPSGRWVPCPGGDSSDGSKGFIDAVKDQVNSARDEMNKLMNPGSSPDSDDSTQ